MNAQESSGFNTEDRVLFTIIGFLLLGLAVILLWPGQNGTGGVDESATFEQVLPEPEIEETVVAIVTPEPSVAPETPLLPKPVEAVEVAEPVVEDTVAVEPEGVAVDASEGVATQEPRFDLVRVEEGSAMVAGKAAPNTDVRLMVDGKEVGTVRTDAIGAFAMFADLPTGDTPLNLVLETVGGDVVKSTQQVLVVPSKTDSAEAPKVIIAQTDGDVVVQEPTVRSLNVQALSLETINYSNRGDVIFAGRGTEDQSVRVYVDNKPVSLGEVDNGTWKFEVPDIKEGIYTVRVDAIDESGQVIERVESPFQRVMTEMDAGAVTIQPGFTLWQLAELKYGSGDRFVQIFDANRDLIKDPDMIFPGQIFAVPEQ
jgi:nucleoid-associated protein YgaU